MMRKKRKNENKDEITRLKMRGKVHFIKCNDPRSIQGKDTLHNSERKNELTPLIERKTVYRM